MGDHADDLLEAIEWAHVEKGFTEQKIQRLVDDGTLVPMWLEWRFQNEGAEK